MLINGIILSACTTPGVYKYPMHIDKRVTPIADIRTLILNAYLLMIIHIWHGPETLIKTFYEPMTMHELLSQYKYLSAVYVFNYDPRERGNKSLSRN